MPHPIGNLFSLEDVPPLLVVKGIAEGIDFRAAARRRRALKDEEENRKDAEEARDPYAIEDN